MRATTKALYLSYCEPIQMIYYENTQISYSQLYWDFNITIYIAHIRLRYESKSDLLNNPIIFSLRQIQNYNLWLHKILGIIS